MEWDPGTTDFAFLPPDQALEGRELPAGRIFLRKPEKREFLAALRREKAHEILQELPAAGHSIHVIGNGEYDFFDWIPVFLELLPDPAAGWFSTWTMNRGNALDLLRFYDEGKLTSITMLTGLYFKRRETAVYATISEGLQERGQRYLAFLNHTKLILLRAGGYSITIEGSANLTSNPRLEQYVITNDPGLLDFHLGWIERLTWDE